MQALLQEKNRLEKELLVADEAVVNLSKAKQALTDANVRLQAQVAQLQQELQRQQQQFQQFQQRLQQAPPSYRSPGFQQQLPTDDAPTNSQQQVQQLASVMQGLLSRSSPAPAEVTPAILNDQVRTQLTQAQLGLERERAQLLARSVRSEEELRVTRQLYSGMLVRYQQETTRLRHLLASHGLDPDEGAPPNLLRSPQL
ncbi:hypothetical protein PAPYR_1737 [Paratrimastix pyriformis]|uniref:Uncharacterized protein n=1 Tax=Paratrimastix pyriformis TaxID=342808 RepID=A0ABQ8UY12_9EUKA|nr:hypothetical protein PAPYR_1737 [Paratrimastix pyriformis]